MSESNTVTNEDIKATQPKLQGLATEISNHFYGPSEFIDRLTATLAADGHILMEATPGTSKTVLAKGAAVMIGGTFGRIQGTPDVRPSDITLYREPDLVPGSWKITRGPIFNDVVLADELNRLPSKTQSALLEAMEEGQVTAFGQSHELSPNLKVIATQNPWSNNNGTSELGDAVKDRFSYGLNMPVPSQVNKARAWTRQEEHPVFGQILNDCGVDLKLIRKTANKVRFDEELKERIFDIEQAFFDLTSDNESLVSRGSAKVIESSMRPGRALVKLAQMAVLLEGGKVYVSSLDIDNLAPSVYAHRIKPTHTAVDKGLSAVDLVEMAVEQANKNS